MNNASKIEGLPGISSLSIEHSDYFGWYTLEIPFLSFNVRLYTAKNISGPWVDQGIVYTIPEKWKIPKTETGENIFIPYAARIHPQSYSSPNKIIFSYIVNTNPLDKNLAWKLPEYMKNPLYKDVYLPHFVTLQFIKK